MHSRHLYDCYNKTRGLIKPAFLLIFLFGTINTAFADKAGIPASPRPHTHAKQTTTPPPPPEDHTNPAIEDGKAASPEVRETVLREVRKSNDGTDNNILMAIGIFGAIIVVLTLVFGGKGILGFFKDFEKDTQKILEKGRALVEELKTAKAVSQKKKTRKIKKQVGNLLESLRKKIKDLDISPGKESTQEQRDKVSEFAQASDIGEALGVRPTAEDYCNRGTHYFFNGNSKAALNAIDKAIELDPDDLTAWNNKCRALRVLDRHAEALTVYKKAIELNPDDRSVRFNKGVILIDLDRDEEAIAVYEKIIELNPGDYDAWFTKGLALHKLNRHEEALAAYEKAIELKPDLHLTWYSKGSTLLKIDRFEEALAAFEKAIELNPDNYKAWTDMGIALVNLNRYEEALAAHEKATALKPDHHLTWYNKGVALQKIDRFEEALAAYEKAIELNPDSCEAWANKGSVLGGLNRHEEALTAFERAIKLKQDDGEIWFGRACTYALMGKKQEMLSSLKKAIDLDPSNKEKAKKDEEFKAFWDDEDFKKLVE